MAIPPGVLSNRFTVPRNKLYCTVLSCIPLRSQTTPLSLVLVSHRVTNCVTIHCTHGALLSPRIPKDHPYFQALSLLTNPSILQIVTTFPSTRSYIPSLFRRLPIPFSVFASSFQYSTMREYFCHFITHLSFSFMQSSSSKQSVFYSANYLSQISSI